MTKKLHTMKEEKNVILHITNTYSHSNTSSHDALTHIFLFSSVNMYREEEKMHSDLFGVLFCLFLTFIRRTRFYFILSKWIFFRSFFVNYWNFTRTNKHTTFYNQANFFLKDNCAVNTQLWFEGQNAQFLLLRSVFFFISFIYWWFSFRSFGSP